MTYKTYYIEKQIGLDPITVLLKQNGKECNVIIECYSWAWAHYFSSVNQPIEDFISKCDSDYLTESLMCKQRKSTKKEEQYLNRICVAVIRSFKNV